MNETVKKGTGDTKPFFSLIVPVYNVEKYIEQCLDSMLDQDISKDEYEIVCVDDGSTDRSGQILDRYSGNEKNIKVIHQANGGLSAARNTGIRNATGVYFWFIDSDDYIKKCVLGKIKKILLQNDYDALCILPHLFPDGEAFDEDSASPSSEYSFLLTQRFIKSSIIKDHQLFFEESIRFIEDAPFDIQLKPFLKRVETTEEVCYFYRQRAGSLMGSKLTVKIRNRIRTAVFCRDIMDGKRQGDTTAAIYYYYVCISEVMSGISKLPENERKEFLKEVISAKLLPLRLSFKYTPNTAKKTKTLKKRIRHRLNDFSYVKPVFFLLVALNKR